MSKRAEAIRNTSDVIVYSDVSGRKSHVGAVIAVLLRLITTVK